jgi:hypothetical protein
MEEKKLLPQEINEIFSKLQSEIIWLYGRWIIFEQLYGKSPERVELLNEAAATYFRITQDVLLSDILIHIGRITDKPKIQGNENLSLEQIIARLDKNKYSDLVKTLEEKMENIRILSRGIRQYRNKRLAHQDIRIALKKAEVMPEVTFGSIRSTLEAICDFMNGCELYFCDNEMAYEAFAMRADGKALITRLKKAIAYDELEKDGVIERGYWRRKSRFKDA